MYSPGLVYHKMLLITRVGNSSLRVLQVKTHSLQLRDFIFTQFFFFFAVDIIIFFLLVYILLLNFVLGFSCFVWSYLEDANVPLHRF